MIKPQQRVFTYVGNGDEGAWVPGTVVGYRSSRSVWINLDPGSAQVWNYLENVRDLDTHAKITLTQ